ncbi:MAG TPA: PIG-L family deacetylase [Firmicutes bacterium]|nr:PIG-L family deacetylase [Bacillota bacterium]
MQSKVSSCSVFSLTMFVLWFALYAYPAAAANTVFWYLPHPDDETLGMADSIYQSFLAGNDNYFIYFTKGTGSLARFLLNGPDGQIYQLSEAEFGQARVEEALAALAMLGIKREQVIFLDYQDGNIPQKDVEAIMRALAKLHPGSSHRTVHIQDLHPDHQTLARALANVARENEVEISTEYYHVYVYRSQLPTEQLNRRPVLYPEIKNQALAEFGRWEPDQNRYAIGMSSTPDLFNAVRSSPYEYVDHEIGEILEKSVIASHLVVSTLDAGYQLSLGQRLSVICSVELKSSALQLGVHYRLKSNLPMLNLALGAGYHFGHKQPYGMLTAEITDYLILAAKHIYKTDTNLALGVRVQLF